MAERGEHRLNIPPDTIGIRFLNRYFFASEHLGDCLGEVENGTVFTGQRLDNFRQSNRVCRELNVIASTVEGAISTALVLAGRGKGLKRKLISAGGILMLAHTTVHAKGAFEKSQRQALLDSRESISKQDLRIAKQTPYKPWAT